MNTATIFLAFCALAAASTLGADAHKVLHETIAKCIKETGVDPDIFKSKWEIEDVDADDKVKCFSACMMKAHGMMTEDGTVDVEAGKADIPSDVPNRDKILAALDTCGTEKGANMCDTAHAIAMCMHKNLKGIMPHLA